MLKRRVEAAARRRTRRNFVRNARPTKNDVYHRVNHEPAHRRYSPFRVNPHASPASILMPYKRGRNSHAPLTAGDPYKSTYDLKQPVTKNERESSVRIGVDDKIKTIERISVYSTSEFGYRSPRKMESIHVTLNIYRLDWQTNHFREVNSTWEVMRSKWKWSTQCARKLQLGKQFLFARTNKLQAAGLAAQRKNCR